jgi:Cu+-exporting ATPase
MLIQKDEFSVTIIGQTHQPDFKSSKRRRVVISIEGMTCTSCSGTIERALENIQGVDNVVVSLSTNTANVEFFEEAGVSAERLVDAVECVGFGATALEDLEMSDGLPAETTADSNTIELRRVLLTIDGTLSRTAVSDIIHALEILSGVSEVAEVPVPKADAVKETQIKATIDENIVGPRVLVAAVQTQLPKPVNVAVTSFGGFMMAGRLSRQQAREQRKQWHAMLLACALTIPILIIGMLIPLVYGHMTSLEDLLYPGLTVSGLLMFLLATPVQFYVGWKFHIKAYKTLKTGSLGMDFLISSGTFAAYLFSLGSLLRGISTKKPSMNVEFFETSSVLIAVVIIGKYLECYSRGVTAKAIHELSSLRAQTARLVKEAHSSQLSTPQGGLSSSADDVGLPSDSYTADENTSAAAFPAASTSLATTTAPTTTAATTGDRLIDASLVQKGDILRLVGGESVPADGVLQSNTLGVDESMMTVSEEFSYYITFE